MPNHLAKAVPLILRELSRKISLFCKVLGQSQSARRIKSNQNRSF